MAVMVKEDGAELRSALAPGPGPASNFRSGIKAAFAPALCLHGPILKDFRWIPVVTVPACARPGPGPARTRATCIFEIQLYETAQG